MDELLVFSVQEVTLHLKQVIETQIEPLYIRGEISNYTRHGSGHLYFNLKDDNSTLRCTFFRYANQKLDFEPENGMEVICFGQLTVYEKGGTYNLNVQSMVHSGKGDLALRFELLKKKLLAEGLFEQSAKQPLPRYPQRIGIVTSPSGAALQDIGNILKRRFPVEALVYPALVQGSEAPAQLIAGLAYFNAANNVDLIIITRGGGSQEDLWCFNDEALARKIFASRIPVISAVGHEIDFTIADFVADLRAPTPSAAAELAVPDRKDLLGYLSSLGDRLDSSAEARLNKLRSRLGAAELTFQRFHPDRIWQNLQQRLDMASLGLKGAETRLLDSLHRYEMRTTLAAGSLQSALQFACLSNRQALERLKADLGYRKTSYLTAKRNQMEKLELQLKNLSPFAILNKGYGLVIKDGAVIGSVSQMRQQEELKLVMHDGQAGVRVESLHPGPANKSDAETV